MRVRHTVTAATAEMVEELGRFINGEGVAVRSSDWKALIRAAKKAGIEMEFDVLTFETRAVE